MWRREHNTAWLFKVLVAGLLMVATPLAAPLAQENGPEAVIDRLNGTLLEVMQSAGDLGYQGRYERLEPVLGETYSFPFMTRVATGRSWQELSAEQQDHLVDLFEQVSVANYAARFDGYSGEQFEIVDQKAGPRDAILVESRIVRQDQEPVGLNYLLREFDDGWRVIDVFLDARFSELARQRSEFTAILQNRGYEGLAETLKNKIQTLGSN